MDRKVLVATGIFAIFVIIMLTLVLVNLLGSSSYSGGEPSALPAWTPATTIAEASPPPVILELRDVIPEAAASIYFTPNDDGIWVYSEATDSVRHFGDTRGNVMGVAYDPRRTMLYYSTFAGIHRVGTDGTSSAQIVLPFSTTQYGANVWGIAVDWITGNLYGASFTGYVFTCATAAAAVTLNCKTLLTGQGTLNGLAVNPNRGIMYWTKEFGSLVKADMDGSNATVIVSRLVGSGLAIDYLTSRLYWVELHSGIMSSNPEGGDAELIVRVSDSIFGIAVSSRRIYWGLWYEGNTLHGITKTGQDQKTLFTAKQHILHMTVVEGGFPVTRSNDCDGQACSGICVLTPISFQCVT